MITISWVADGVCELTCSCGEVHTVSNEEFTTCDKCGRRYKLVQYVLREPPLGRCAWCNKWIHGVQRARKKYCSEECGVLARRNKKLSTV